MSGPRKTYVGQGEKAKYKTEPQKNKPEEPNYLKDLIIRNTKSTWYLLALVIASAVISLLVYNAPNLSAELALMIINIVVTVLTGIAVIFLLVRQQRRGKSMNFSNWAKVQRITYGAMALCMGITMVFYMGMTIWLDMSFDPMVGLGIIYALFVIIMIPTYVLRKYYMGSVREWYDNIIVRAGREIEDTQDGYTDRPYSMPLLDPKDIESWGPMLEVYAKVMADEVLIAGYKRFPHGIEFILPAPQVMQQVQWADPAKVRQPMSKVLVYNDGTLSVTIDPDDYKRIGTQVTYHELCRKILRSFSGSIKAFMEGSYLKSIELLGGKGLRHRRRQALKINSMFAARLTAVLVVVNLLLMIGFIHQSAVVFDKDVGNRMHWGSYDDFITVYMQSQHMPFIGLSSVPRVGDSFEIEFHSAIVLSSVVVRSQTTKDYQTVDVTQTLTNVDHGTFSVTQKSGYGTYWLVMNIFKFNLINQTIVHVKITQTNADSQHNFTIAIILLAVYSYAEYLYWRPRIKAPIELGP